MKTPADPVTVSCLVILLAIAFCAVGTLGIIIWDWFCRLIREARVWLQAARIWLSFKTECAWCDRRISGSPFVRKQISHGICPACAVKVTGDNH